jgi:hypothetical protein
MGSGVSFSFLLATRFQNIIYLLPLLPIILSYLFRDFNLIKFLHISLFCIPILIFFYSQGVVNLWMTGDFLKSTYQFGNDSFKSVDFANLNLKAILFHPCHSIFAFHPVFGILFCLNVVALFVMPSWLNKVIVFSVILSVIFNIWLQSGWYCWWLGSVTFGMRGSLLSFIMLLPFSYLVVEYYLTIRVKAIIRLIILLCVIFSSTFIFTENMIFECYNFQQYKNVLMHSTQSMFSFLFYYLMVIISSFFLFKLFGRKLKFHLNDLFNIFYLFSLISLLFVAIFDLQRAYFFILPVFVILVYGLIEKMRSLKFTFAKLFLLWNSTILCVLFCVCCFQFHRLFSDIESKAKLEVNKEKFIYQAPFQIDEIVQCAKKYQKIDGFIEEKTRLEKFTSTFDKYKVE